jgi:tetratricopeptide (TPR) repeat protein
VDEESNGVMVLTDLAGFPLTTSSAEAAAHFRDGLRRLRSAGALATDLDEPFRRAVEADTQFVLGHVAVAQFTAAPRSDEVRARVQTAVRLAGTAPPTPREQRHVEVAVLARQGEIARALDLARAHLGNFPRDELMLRRASALNGRLGGPDRQQRALALYAEVAPHYRDDAWFLGHYGFMHVAAGEYAAARPLLERALALEPRSGTLAHAFAHLCADSGDLEGGAAFLGEFLAGDDPAGGFYAHNSWHLMALQVELGRVRAAERGAQETGA